MPALFFVIGFAVILFLVSFLTKRRYGILAMALGTGYLISTNWAGTVTPFIEQQGVVLVAPPLSMVVATVLTLLPPILLLFSGPKYSDMISRVIASAAFAVLALAFLIVPLTSGLVLEGQTQGIFSFIAQWQSTIIVVGLIAAVLDIMLYKPPKDKDKGKK
jgi:hypothetical protein